MFQVRLCACLTSKVSTVKELKGADNLTSCVQSSPNKALNNIL